MRLHQRQPGVCSALLCSGDARRVRKGRPPTAMPADGNNAYATATGHGAMRSILVIAALILAGCAGDAPAPVEDGDAPTLDVDVSDELGAISGVVVDVAIVPIAGAAIEIVGQGQNTTSDENGLFGFGGLAPGNYFLQVSAKGYDGIQTSVSVVAGEIAKPRIQLQAVASIEPVHYTLKHDGYIQFSGAVAGGITNIVLREVTGDDPTCECGMEFNTEGQDLKTMVVEAFWTPSTSDPMPFCQDCLYLEVYPAELDDDTDDIQGGFLPNPIYQYYPYEVWDADGDENNVDWRANLSGNGYWVNIQQQYELFVTVFANAPAPEGWSIQEGS